MSRTRTHLPMRATALLMLVAGLNACGQATHVLSDQASVIELLKQSDAPFSVDGKPFTGKVVARYSEDQLSAEVDFKKGRPDGVVRAWHPNGQLLAESEGRWDEEAGRSFTTSTLKRWNENGVLMHQTGYNSDGNFDGERIDYCPEGKPQRVERHADGVLDGDFELWDCDSALRLVSLRFKDGKAQGEVLEFYPDGKPRLKAQADAGALVGPIQYWHANGTVAEQGTGVNVPNHPLAEFTISDLSRSQHSAQLPQIAALSGDYKRFDEAGTLLQEASYDAQAQPTGTWRERNSAGNYDRKDYDRAAYISDEYAPAIAKALNSRNAKDAEAIFYYLEQKLIRPDQKLPAKFNAGFWGGSWLSYDEQPGSWPRRHWSYPIHGLAFRYLPRLLEAGAVIDARDSDERTRLILCAEQIQAGRCTAQEIAFLLAQKADPQAQDGQGRNALRALGVKANPNRFQQPNPAVEHAQALEALIAAGSSLDARDGKGNSLLIDALSERKTELAKKLIEAGAEVKTPNLAGNAPIHFVFLTRDDSINFGVSAFTREVLPLLIAKGADVDQSFKWDDGKQTTLRSQALKYGSVEAVQLLDANGAERPAP